MSLTIILKSLHLEYRLEFRCRGGVFRQNPSTTTLLNIKDYTSLQLIFCFISITMKLPISMSKYICNYARPDIKDQNFSCSHQITMSNPDYLHVSFPDVQLGF